MKRLIFLTMLVCSAIISCSDPDPGYEREPTGQKEIVKIRIDQAELGTIEKHVQMSGEVLATDIVRISPDASGFLSEIMVKPGDRVVVDQVIAKVDPSRPGMSFSVSPVKSKTAGTVTRVPVVAGNQVSPQIVIAEIGNLQNLEIECRIPEKYLASLKPGLTARITSRAYPDDVTKAVVVEISPVVDPRSRTVLTTLKPLSNRRIRPGQSVLVDLILENHDGVVLIPEAAVTERYSEKGVFLVQKDKSVWRKVETGLIQRGMIEVTEGLVEGDPVAVAGVDMLTDGLYVQVVD